MFAYARSKPKVALLIFISEVWVGGVSSRNAGMTPRCGQHRNGQDHVPAHRGVPGEQNACVRRHPRRDQDDGQRTILLDWKCANAVYADFLYQFADYGLLWNENYPDHPLVGGFHLCRFAKEQGDFSPADARSVRSREEGRAALALTEDIMTITPTTEAMLLDQVRALATDDPDFFLDLLELIAALDASIVDDESLVDGAKAVLDKLQARRGAAENRTELRRQLLAHTLQQIRLKTLRTPIATLTLAEARLIVRVRIVISKGYTRRFKRSRFSRAFFSSRSLAHLTMMANRKKNETIKKIGLVTSSSSK